MKGMKKNRKEAKIKYFFKDLCVVCAMRMVSPEPFNWMLFIHLLTAIKMIDIVQKIGGLHVQVYAR